MDKTPTIKVSHSRSGFNIYLPDVAVAPLTKTTLSVEVTGDAEGGYGITLRPGEGVNRFTSHMDPLRPHRLTVRELRKTGVKLKEVELFGITEVDWTHVTNSGPHTLIRFHTPPVSRMSAPTMKRKKKNIGAGGRQLNLGFQAPVNETPHSKLGRLLKDINTLLSSGEVDDVEIQFQALSENDGDVLAVAQKGSLAQIKGRIVREEFLG